MKKDDGPGIPRRGFIAGGAACLALGATGCLPDVDGAWQDEGAALCTATQPQAIAASEPGRVVELHDPKLVLADDFKREVVAAQVPLAMRQLILGLTKEPDISAAWKKLIPDYQPSQIIGIKVNVLNPRVPTNFHAVQALVEMLKEGLGVAGSQVVIWDRRLDEFTSAFTRTDYDGAALGAPLEATLEDVGVVGEGRGYELDAACVGGIKTHLTKMLTRRVDHLINFSVMKNHRAAGFTGCMKNNYGLIDNPGTFHNLRTQEGLLIEDRVTNAIGEINALGEVGLKTRLWLMDAMVGVCFGDTADPSDCAPARLLASLDPVAIDVRGKQIRDEARVAAGSEPNDEELSAKWLERAEQLGLGSRAVDLESLEPESA